jgi:prepilin-type N-terminal cleavage/methylation domain-containing protein
MRAIHSSGSRARRGFSLIEIFVVVLIIAALMGMGIPTFKKYLCRSKQSEFTTMMKSNLKALQGYMIEYGAYSCPSGTSLPSGVDVVGNNMYFGLESGTVSCTTTRVTLVMCDNKASISPVNCGDRWLFDSENLGTMGHLTEACK